MGNDLFVNKNLSSYWDILCEYQKYLEERTENNKWGKRYLIQFEFNEHFYKSINADFKVRNLPLVFKKLYAIILDDIKTESHFDTHKEDLFKHKTQLEYLNEFWIEKKIFFKQLNKDLTHVSDGDELKKYYRKFLIVTTFFCDHYNLKFVLHKSNEVSIEQLTNTEKQLKEQIKEYYLFYNRSQIQKMQIGIGQVIIRNDETVEVSYIYKAQHEKGYDYIETKGEVKSYTQSSILVFKSLIDATLYGKENKAGEGFESFYVLKNIDAKSEKIMVGIYCHWNRDNRFPSSTAVLLFDKEAYDQQFRNLPYSFEQVKKSRTVPPAVFYYLYHQSINVENAVQRINTKDKTKFLPFISYSDLPFYSEEVRYLSKIAGRYKGLSIVKRDGRDKLIISQLDISENGIVELTIKTEKEQLMDFSENANKGFIKRLEMNNSVGEGRLFMSLRYNYSKHYNSINFCLDFKEFSHADSNGKLPFYLKGGFAGKSLISDKSIAASVIFQKVALDDEIEAMQMDLTSINGDEDKKQAFASLYKSHIDLFNFYITRDCDEYTNQQGVEILRRELDKFGKADIKRSVERGFDIFISIPMTYSRTEKEYERNCEIAVFLKNELISKFGFEESGIFCACFNGSTCYSYVEYRNLSKRSGVVYATVTANLKRSNTLILLYPKCSHATEVNRISSSIVEVSYAIGLGKNVIMLYDEEERDNLPMNLMVMNEQRSLVIDSAKKNPIQEFLNHEIYYAAFKRLLYK